MIGASLAVDWGDLRPLTKREGLPGQILAASVAELAELAVSV